MSIIKHPGVLIDLGHVGDKGLPLNDAPWFQQELELCREWGFPIKVSADRVRLDPDPDALVPYWIQKETPAIAWDWLRIYGFLSVDSTNKEAIEMARKGAPSGTLVYSEEQSEGKGRKGRNWFSPAKMGLYFSVIIRPARERRYWPLLTHIASIALAETLKTLSPANAYSQQLKIDIKWPNDVLLSGKKCAGILLETLTSEGDNPAAVIGVGIDVHPGSVPENLSGEAVCLDEMLGVFVPRRQLLVRFLHIFQQVYSLFDKGRYADILERWKALSSMWNQVPILISEGSIERKAVTCGLNEIGALLVRTEAGSVETIMAGDIRIRRDVTAS